MYRWFMIIAIPLLAAGWGAYLLWDRKMRREEDEEPTKQVSSRLTKSRGEVADWAQQMASFKKPPGPSSAPDKQQNKD